MKMIPCLFFIIFLRSQLLNAQPGGGGGVQIMKIIVPDPGWKYKTLSKKDTSLKINAYFLTLTKDKEIRSILPNTALTNYDPYDFADKVFTHVYLPPFTRHNGKNILTPDQRLELVYKGDTMTIDIFDILSENGAGRTDKIDTLSFYPGHYLRVYRDINKKVSYYYPGTSTGNRIRTSELDSIHRFVQMGITDHTLPLLNKYELVEWFSKPVRTIFFRDNNYDTLWLRSFPVYTLDLENVSIQSKKINIKTNDPAVWVDNKLNYKFYFNYIPVFRLSDEKKEQQKAKKAHLLLQQLKIIPLYVNGKAFTGTIKWLVPFHNMRYGGTGLYIHTFNNGLLVKEDIRHDVDQETESPLDTANELKMNIKPASSRLQHYTC